MSPLNRRFDSHEPPAQTRFQIDDSCRLRTVLTPFLLGFGELDS